MCGIAGFAGFEEPGLLRRMCDTILHRGPDGEGFAHLPEARISIGMRRLAIIDLVTGDQPFVSDDRRVHLVFNGEIYNYVELRDELRRLGHTFRTRSDTEVVLRAFLEWGNDAWARLRGMFAIAIADMRPPEPQLLIVRDHVGMKPLYTLERDGCLLFASEIKALMVWRGFLGEVDLHSVSRYLALRYVPGPDCLFKGVQKLPPGHLMVHQSGRSTVAAWYEAPTRAPQHDAIGPEEAAVRFGTALRAATRRHMVSDVPLGAFLSGGVDSNTLVALMSEVSSRPVKTFTIAFPDFPSDDSRRAALTARALNTDHHPIACRAADFTALPDIIWSLDEPVGDAIIVPLYVLAREARREVKVVLSGEGADEILGGYMFHRKLLQMDRVRRRLPSWIWPIVQGLIARTPARILDRMFEYPGSLGEEGRRKIAAMIGRLGRNSLEQLYRASISLFDPDDIRAATAGALDPDAVRRDAQGAPDPFDRLVDVQFRDWLPDLILGKYDKLTMAHSLEGRVPFMDPDVIAAAAAIPPSRKIARTENKIPLRDFARTILPPEIADAPKEAFYIPLESYIQSTEMKDLLRHTLDPDRLRRRGLISSDWIARLTSAPAGAGFLPLKRVFAIVALELWFERFFPDASWA
jgi:asparagine synthase (glutamine-hydrolysing)